MNPRRDAPNLEKTASGLAIGQGFNPYKRFPGALIPEPVCKYRGLSPGAKVIYGRLARFAGEDGAVYPSVQKLADETGMSATQARGYLKELERKRFIHIDRENRHYRKGGIGGSNDYTFLWHEAFTGCSGAFRKAPPPLRKTEGVPLRESAPLTPAENCTQRESSILRESVEESQSTSDYQPTNRKNGDSHAGLSAVTDETPRSQTQNAKSISTVGSGNYTAEEREWLTEAIGSYGRRQTMRQHMDEEVPPAIVQKCMEAAGGTPRRDIGEILRYKCVNRGLDPGTRNGPQGWGWFPVIIATEIRARREQAAAAEDPLRKDHWSEYRVEPNMAMGNAITAFDTLDDLGATA